MPGRPTHSEAHLSFRSNWLRAAVLDARLGGAPAPRAVVRVVSWAAVAVAATSAIGALVGSAI